MSFAIGQDAKDSLVAPDSMGDLWMEEDDDDDDDVDNDKGTSAHEQSARSRVPRSGRDNYNGHWSVEHTDDNESQGHGNGSVSLQSSPGRESLEWRRHHVTGRFWVKVIVHREEGKWHTVCTSANPVGMRVYEICAGQDREEWVIAHLELAIGGLRYHLGGDGTGLATVTILKLEKEISFDLIETRGSRFPEGTTASFINFLPSVWLAGFRHPRHHGTNLMSRFLQSRLDANDASRVRGTDTRSDTSVDVPEAHRFLDHLTNWLDQPTRLATFSFGITKCSNTGARSTFCLPHKIEWKGTRVVPEFVTSNEVRLVAHEEQRCRLEISLGVLEDLCHAEPVWVRTATHLLVHWVPKALAALAASYVDHTVGGHCAI